MTLDATFVTRWLVAFALTQAIEVPIYVRALHVSPWAAFGASAITHPILWFVVVPVWARIYVAAGLHWSDLPYDAVLHSVGESFAVLAEALWFRLLYASTLSTRRALLGSLLANGASYGTGLLLQLLFRWP